MCGHHSHWCLAARLVYVCAYIYIYCVGMSSSVNSRRIHEYLHWCVTDCVCAYVCFCLLVCVCLVLCCFLGEVSGYTQLYVLIVDVHTNISLCCYVLYIYIYIYDGIYKYIHKHISKLAYIILCVFLHTHGIIYISVVH